MYVAHASRTVTVQELRDALSVHPGHSRANIKYRPTEKMILECCQGLIAVDSATAAVRPCHYSVKEYLLANDHTLFPRAEAILATKCLRYLLLDNFSTGPWAEKETIPSYKRDHAFLSYAAIFWGGHAKLAEDDALLQDALRDFFASTRAMATANQVRQHTVGYRPEYWATAECLSLPALHHACREGLTATVGRLLASGTFDVNVATAHGATPVIQAAANGHVDIVRMLMHRGADPRVRNWYGNALDCAIEGGRAAVVRELVVSWGMELETPIRLLYRAMARDSDEAFEALVDLGVDINAAASEPCLRIIALKPPCPGHRADRAGLHVFLAACSAGCRKIVKLMVDRGWVDVNARYDGGWTALHWAAQNGSRTIVERLVEVGADVHAKDDDGVSALELIEPLYRSLGRKLLLVTGW